MGYKVWRHRQQIVLPILILLAFAAAASGSELALVGAKIYPAPAAAPINDGIVVIREGHILAVGAKSTLKAPAGATILDITGKVVTAGFWNSHVHIFTHELLHAEQKSAAALSAALDSMLNRWGFTTVFDVASILKNTNLIRQRIQEGSVFGPNILTVGEPFFPLNGTPIYIRKFVEEEHIVLPEATSIPNAIERERREIREGADGIKLFTGDIVGGDVGVEPMSLALAKALVAQAHRDGKLVFAHPSNLEGVNIALDSGVDVLAHTASMSGPWGPALIKRMLNQHMALIPTLTLFDVEARKANLSIADTQAMLSTVVGQLRAFHTAGGVILFGTDVGYTQTFDTTEEYRLMHDAGLDYRAILTSLTTAPAQRFGFAKRKGRIEPQMDADLVVLDGDPAEDVTAFAHVYATIRDGKFIHRAPSP